MTFNDLKATEAHFGAEKTRLEAYLPVYVHKTGNVAAGITDIWLVEARLKLRRDLNRTFDWEHVDASIADVESTADWQHLLATTQLVLTYEDLDDGDAARHKLKRYEAEYTRALSGINGLIAGFGLSRATSTTRPRL